MSIYKKEASQEEMKQEAVLRMELLGLNLQTIQSFQLEGTVSLSEQIGQQVILWPADDEVKGWIKNFESEYECLVYHALRAQNPMAGDCWSLLFVSPTSSDWKSEQSYIKSSGLVYAYSSSELEDGISEIVVEKRGRGLARIG